MHRGSKRLALVLSLVAAFSIAVAACGGGEEDAAGTEPVAATQPETSQAQETAASTGAAEAPTTTGFQEPTEPIEIEIWDAREPAEGQPFGDAARKVDQMFMDQHPNITVVRKSFPYDVFLTKLQTAVSAKDGPDVFGSLFGAALVPYVQGFVPLDDRFTPELLDDLYVSPDTQTLGTRYLMPFGVITQPWMYNKQLFEQAGLDPDSPPATWEELLQACDALKAAGITPISATFRDGYQGEIIHTGLAGQLATLEEQDTWWSGGGSWTDAALRRPFEYLIELNDRGCFTKDSTSYTWAEERAFDFNKGEAAIYVGVSSPDYELVAKDAGLAVEDIGIFQTPRLPESAYTDQYIEMSNFEGLGITAWSENQDAAWELLKFHASPEGQQVYWEDAGIPPSSRSSQATSDLPQEQQILEWIKNPEGHYGPYGTIEEETILWKRFPQLVTGQFSVDQLVDDLQKIREKVLDN